MTPLEEAYTTLTAQGINTTEAELQAALMFYLNNEKAENALRTLDTTEALKAPLLKVLENSLFNDSIRPIRNKFLTNALLAQVILLAWKRIQNSEPLVNDPRLQLQIMTVLMSRKAFTLSRDEIDFFRHLVKISDLSEAQVKTLVRRHYTNHSMPGFMFDSYNHSDPAYFNLLLTPKNHIPQLKVLERYNKAAEQASLIAKAQANEVYVKIVAPDRYADYLKQLSDYTHRPPLRAEVPNAAFKLVHATGQVVAYQRHQNKNKPPYTHTKKSSATLISDSLHTPVFGSHASRVLVGYLFNKPDCVVKAMFKQDQGTYVHHWLASTEASARQAANLIPNYLYTDEELFKQQVNNPATGITNEVLLKVSKQAILAIVIANLTQEARRIASERQKDALEKLGMNVPIAHYDSNAKKLEIIEGKRGLRMV